MLKDVEIARNTKLKNIVEIAKKIGLDENDLELYGKYKAKISQDAVNRIKNLNGRDSRLILMTAINPTPAGEGKTTLTIGLGQALSKLDKMVVLALREPSLGPCFGVKGGATGGGYSQVAPMEEINLHFTGDIHAITTAHNLVSALIDNHINFGNKLNIEKVVWKRVVDLNDRALRNVVVGIGDDSGKVREDSFMITVASEIMAVLCLSEDLNDLKDRLSRIIIGHNDKGENITLKDINGVGSVAVLLKEAIKPNLVQTLEGVPVLIHGGPFANIAHGCNSIIATKIALKLADYVVTEAGFGADLGAEKFLDIKCRKANLTPSAAVIVATCRSLKYNGGVDKKDLESENLDALKIGVVNLVRHVENLKKYNLPIIVALNKFDFDTKNEIDFIEKTCGDLGVKFTVCEAWAKGGEGALDLAQKVIDSIEDNRQEFRFLYDLNLSLKEKVKMIAQEIYRTNNVVFSPKASKKLKQYTETGFGELPICIAKTQYSFSDNPTLLGAPEDFIFTVGDASLSAGAGFVVCLAGDIMTMPGLPKVPAANNIDIDKNGDVVGIF
ncbi:MAG: formate--tetrahydrofolate ligase [Rickettsiales bacterium]|jgi:formate--tetrahydrofolate ligase|nr:formate--tetrahydrofolate ligase [Rickettsiales bacterium]